MLLRHVCLFSVLLAPVLAVADDEAPSDDPEVRKMRVILDRAPEEFECSATDDDSHMMKPKPVLRWTNNERDSKSMGSVVLWIDRGQPAAAMATYSWAGNLYHEFDLLSRRPMIAKQNATTVWRPQTGLQFKVIPGATPVEANATARLRQMKALSGKFSATMMGWRADKSDRAELRRLPRELYRYEPQNSDVIDGAVYAFVMGTDPEALLLIEAVKEKEASNWTYAFVRQTSGELQGRYENDVVWSAPMHVGRTDPAAPGLGILSPINLKAALAE